MNRSAELVTEVPPGVVTVTSTVPLPTGLTAVICLSVFTEKLAAVAPNSTWLTLLKPVPLIVTIVPPAAGPDVGEMLAIVGIGGIGGAPW
jgi:hypothetical protein